MSHPHPISRPRRILTKAMLLCAYAEELSRQCAIAIHDGHAELLVEIQVRKHTVIEELAASLTDHSPPELEEIRQAVEKLRSSLTKEMLFFREAAQECQSGLLEVRAAQRRLVDLRQYSRGSDAHHTPTGSQIYVCG